MTEQTSTIPPVLESAWKRFSDYDNTAEHQQDQFYLLRRWVLYLSILATFLAILLDNIRTWYPGIPNPVVRILQVILILVPLIGSGVVAYINIFKQGQKYLSMRAGAEEILKNIFLYRTVMQGNPKRNKWLNNRLAEIQRQVHRSLGGEVVVKPYTGEHLNPRYFPDSANADEGIDDLDSAEYLRVRLDNQLVWHIDKIQGHQNVRMRLTIVILLFGGLGAFFAGLDMLFAGIAVWVALSTAISTAVTNWQQLLGVEAIIPNYSKVILELNILRDHWLSLTPQERTQTEFFKLVRSTEKVLWSQNAQFISAMKESMDEAEAEQEKMVAGMIELSQEVAGRVQEEIIEEGQRSMEEAAQAAAAAASGMPIDDAEKLPGGMIFNAALGPAQAVIVSDDDEDAPDGFADAEEADKEVTSKKAGPDSSKEEEEDDPVLTEINSAVDAAIEESEAVRTSSQKQSQDDVEDLASAAPPDSEDE